MIFQKSGSRAVQPPFGAPILVADGQLRSNCRNQAIALRTPIVSAMAMFQQLSGFVEVTSLESGGI